MNQKDLTQKTYDECAEMLAAEFNSVGARIEDIERAFSFVRKFNPFVLEIGCGNGRDAKEILLRTNRYVGVDNSSSMIKLAKQTAPQGEFITIDAEDLEFLFSEELDIVFAFVSLSHFDKDAVKTILDRAYEKMGVGGIFYISLKYGEYREFLKEDEYGQRVFYFYTPEDIKALAGEKLSVVFERKFVVRGKEWFTIILKK